MPFEKLSAVPQQHRFSKTSADSHQPRNLLLPPELTDLGKKQVDLKRAYHLHHERLEFQKNRDENRGSFRAPLRELYRMLNVFSGRTLGGRVTGLSIDHSDADRVLKIRGFPCGPIWTE
jgi:hypothetical protein